MPQKCEKFIYFYNIFIIIIYTYGKWNRKDKNIQALSAYGTAWNNSQKTKSPTNKTWGFNEY